MRSYDPVVACDSRRQNFNDKGACKQLLNTLPADNASTWFTRFKSPDPKPQVVLPTGGAVFRDRMSTLRGVLCRLLLMTDNTVTGMCQAIVDLRGNQRERSSWFDVWAAAVAVERMCVRKGVAGIAYTSSKSQH